MHHQAFFALATARLGGTDQGTPGRQNQWGKLSALALPAPLYLLFILAPENDIEACAGRPVRACRCALNAVGGVFQMGSYGGTVETAALLVAT
ncbi:MAG: hypothetical protein N838_21560 [Thiohalocapsa sp. PB-PSB1]|jgi:hypothetical protein|nr:MAG: hypothetical protein N838_21560 [Thiohalocapsa sp. PB-PSB1]